jgi:hypothetical protein
MCVICTDLIKKKLTPKEAMRNLWEMEEKLSDEHFSEVFALVTAQWDEEDEKRNEDA